MQGRFFADQAVKFSQVPAFRAEHFPYAGPYPWLDRPDALERVDEKLQRGELTAEEADDHTIDAVWSAYGKAVASRRIRLHLALLVMALSLPVAAQTPAEWQDGLVSHLAGSWKLEGKVTGNNAHHDVRADWVLNRQFLRIQEKTAANAPTTERPYDSIWYLGYDPISERYVLHLMDTFGARFSETLGYGTRDGNQIRFVFEYPDGPFHTTFLWNAGENTWQWLMEQKNKDGKWVPFADLRLTRAESRPGQ